MPTPAEKPSPIANDHQGSEMGKPVASVTPTPMPLPHRMPRIAANRGENRRLGQELEQHFLTAGAERLPHADFARPLGHRNHHDRHHADAADHQRNRGDDEQCQERGAADLIPHAQDGVLRRQVEVVGLVELEPMPDPHDLLDVRQRVFACVAQA